MKYNCAFVTFIYPGIEGYLPQFIESLNNQTDVEFELVVHNDGVHNFSEFFEQCNFPVNIICSGFNDLYQIRIWTFKFCAKVGYKQIIVGDSDDFFAINRVSVSKRTLQDYNIVVNDISLADKLGVIYENRVFSRRIYNQSLIEFKDIKNYNFIGFSNSAFLVEVLNDFSDYSISSKVVDWFFYSVLLMHGNSAIFTTETVSYYRQHSNNIAGLRCNKSLLTDSDKVFFKKVKKNHRNALNKIKYGESKGGFVNKDGANKINFWWEI